VARLAMARWRFISNITGSRRSRLAFLFMVAAVTRCFLLYYLAAVFISLRLSVVMRWQTLGARVTLAR